MKRNLLYLSAIFFLSFLMYSCGSAGALYKKGLKYSDKTEFPEAINYFEQALEKGYSETKANFEIAEAYRRSNRLAEAEPHYRIAVEGGFPEDKATFYFAESLKSVGKYEEAKKQFEIYIRIGQDGDLTRIAREKVKYLEEVEKILAEEHYYEIANCRRLNTPGAEFSPVPFKDLLLFSADRKEGTFSTTGTGFTGIYAYRLRDIQNCIGTPEIFSEIILAEGINEASPTFSRDGSFMIFARGNSGEKEGDRHVNLFKCYWMGDDWTEPEMLEISEIEAWDACPFISPDGEKLYFASNRKGGYGGVDLYEARITPSGDVSYVRNMGAKINTAGNDMFPFVGDDGKFYFASDGRPGLGQLDLFVATIDRSSRKTEVKNMGVPFNSPKDDFAIFYNTDTSGYFSSNRKEGVGGDDIYTFVDNTPKTKIVNYSLAIITMGIEEDSSKVILANSFIEVFNSKEEVIYSGNTDENGRLAAFPVKAHEDYTIVAYQETYFVKRQDYTMRGKAIPEELLTKPVTDTTFETEVVLKKIVIDEPNVLNIYYDVAKADIRPDAALELDRLVQLLKDNPNITIELSSHTDVRGGFQYNMDLSQRRAESAVRYLEENGISRSRMLPKGYGETKLIIENAQTEEEHQVNRRTEFTIIRITE